MVDREGGHGDQGIAEHDARRDLVDGHSRPLLARKLAARRGSDANVFSARSRYGVYHGLGPRRPEHLQWLGLPAFQGPGRQDEVREAEGVIGMQVRHEDAAQIPRLEGSDTLADRPGPPSDDAHAGIDEMGRLVHHGGDFF
jgi:hypothetical protein